MTKPLYVFDLDETLIFGDSAMIWNEFMVEKSIASAPDFIAEDRRLMALYAKGELDMAQYLAFAMAPLAKMPIEQVNALMDECVETRILATQFSQAKSLIAELLNDGIDMMIISASATFIVEAVARRFGIPTALGIDLVEKNGCYTSEIKGTPSFRQGKVIRLQQWLESQGENFSEIHFYTDSINDLPLCEYADRIYLVNPCPRLSAHAKNNTDWAVLKWQV
ncbi:HAD family hydrolase [Vibrio sp. SM6]|uniref:HAD family hydrolase n=1 Tax=Vibrio agarilyticus TaxID=2726741 RepID=A0A7X8TNQ6_9VIBR|nr:HAD family hydrolase [Vibrio agarilyticus]NLS11852.1 HAD family hydrolase [Vibrio agarilyticus]